MDFSIPGPFQQKLASCRTLLDEHVLPLEPRLFSEGYFKLQPALDKARDAVRVAGLYGPVFPPELGGAGLSLKELGLLSKVMGRSPLGHYVFGCQAPDAGNIEVLHEHGTDAQKEQYLAPLVRGDIRSCFCMTEPDNAGSNPTVLSTTADETDDGWVLNGHKWFSTAHDGSRFAIVMAVTEPEGPRHGRASMFIVPTDADGFEHVRNIPLFGHGGEGFFSHSEVKFHDVKVPKDALLGPRGAGFLIAQQRLGPGRIHHCMRWLGIAERALDLMIERAATRSLGDGVLADKQQVQMWIAESKAEIDAATWSVLAAADKVEREGFRAARVEISAIKYLVANIMLGVVDRAVQVQGARGLTDDTVLAFFYAHERGARIYDGPDEVHKLVVAKSLLKGARA